MQIGVVSDTHGQMQYARQAVTMLRSLQVERVLHCGDIGSAAVVELFADWPTDFVFGNCDYARDELMSAIQAAGLSCHGSFGDLQIDGRRVALLHSDDGRRFRETLASGRYELVCYGHTHVAAIDQHGSTLALNPGALYRANPHSLATVDLQTLEATIVEL